MEQANVRGSSPHHLIPEGPLLPFQQTVREYHLMLAGLLAAGNSDDLTLLAVALPSFEPEYLVGLRSRVSTYENRDVHARVFFVRPAHPLWDYERLLMRNESLWSSRNDAEINEMKSRLPVPWHERQIDAAVSEHLAKAWIGVIAQTRLPRHGWGMVLGGTRYRFSANTVRPSGLSRKFISGTTHSPPSNSIPGQLVELVDSMVRYCDGTADAGELERRARELIKRQNRL